MLYGIIYTNTIVGGSTSIILIVAIFLYNKNSNFNIIEVGLVAVGYLVFYIGLTLLSFENFDRATLYYDPQVREEYAKYEAEQKAKQEAEEISAEDDFYLLERKLDILAGFWSQTQLIAHE